MDRAVANQRQRFGNSSRNRPRERHFAYGYHHRNGHRLHGATDTGTCSVRQIKEGETNTNVAELRRLIMATNPTADGKELTDAIRAMTLCGIVVSDKGGEISSPSS